MVSRRLSIEDLEQRLLLTTIDVTAALPLELNADVTLVADLYRVNLAEGQGGRLSIRVTSDDMAAQAAYFTLIDSMSIPIATSVTRSAQDNSSFLEVDLAVSGDYFIQVDLPVAGDVDYKLTTDFLIAGPVFDVNQLNLELGDSTHAASAQLNDDNQDGRIDDFDLIDVVVAGLDRIDVMLGIGGGAFRRPIQHFNFTTNVGVEFVANPIDGGVEIVVVSDAGGVEFLRLTADGTAVELRQEINFHEVQELSAMIAIDVNNDQITDLVLADEGANVVWVMSRDATGMFTERREFPVGRGPVALEHADFNNDQREDIVAVNRASDDVSILLSSPNGGFTVSTPGGSRADTEPTAVAVADLDGDGNPDIIIASFRSDDVSILMGNGAGGFDPGPPLSIRGSQGVTATGFSNNSVSVDDFNEDGFPDIAMTSPVDGRVAIRFGGPDPEATVTTRFELPTSVEHQFSDDFNRDGHRDLLVTTVNNDFTLGFVVLLGSGSGSFFVPDSDLVAGATDVVAADFNGDGISDLASAKRLDGSIVVLIGNGDGSYRFFAETFLGRGSQSDSIIRPVAIESGDFNGDGRVDLVVAEETVSDDDKFVTADSVFVLLGNGDGDFFDPLRFSVHAGPMETRNDLHPRKLAVDDLDGDGLDDLIVANELNSISVFFGVRGGDTVLTKVTQPRFLPLGFQPNDVLTVDIDGDQGRDIVVVGRGDDLKSLGRQMAMFSNDGSGSFTEEMDFLIGDFDAIPLRITSGDFDNDLKTDLALVLDVALVDNATTERAVSILYGDGEGRFQRPSEPRRLPETAVGNSGIAAGDINSDGVLDLVVSDSRRQAVTVYSGSQNRTLALGTQAEFTVNGRPSDVIVFDANADGRADIATVNPGTGNISVLLNADGGTLVPLSELLLPAAVKRPVFADVDNDGVTDSLVLSGNGDVLLRVGRTDELGTFAPPVLVTTDSPALDFTLLKHDSRTFIAAIDQFRPTITIYEVQRSEQSTPTRITEVARINDVGHQPVRVTAADFNGDGREDLVVANAAGPNRVRTLFADSSSSGRPIFRQALEFGSRLRPSGIAVGDIDNDGLVDILVADDAAGEVAMFQNASGQFREVGRFLVGNGPLSVVDDGGNQTRRISRDGIADLALADLNGDQRLDVVSTSRQTNQVSVMLGDGRGHLLTPQLLDVANGPGSTAVADVNDDGTPDIITLNVESTDISVLLGNGDGTFAAQEIRFAAGNAPTGLTVHDVNGDELLDLVVANRFGDVLTLIHNDPAKIELGGDLFTSFQRTDRAVSLAVGDVDRDGINDWIVTNESDDSLAIEFGQNASDRSLREVVRIGSRADGIVAPADAVTAQLNDDNGDGQIDAQDFLDLVVANSGANNVLVYMGRGAGGEANRSKTPFNTVQSFAAGTEPVDLEVRDINSDGQNDIVVTNRGSNDITILLGDHSSSRRSFRPGVRLDVINPSNPGLATGPVSTVVGDFVGVNGAATDGIVDLLVAGSNANAAVLLPGLGNGFFNDVSPIVFDTGAKSTPVGIVELAGFGFATINSGSNNISLFNGFASTSATSQISIGARPVSALQIDFNADSFLDLLVGNNGDGTISILSGGPTGLSLIDTFSADFQHPTALALAELGADDFSLLVADEGDELVAVFNRADIFGMPAILPESVSTELAGISIGSAVVSALTTVLFAGQLEMDDLEPVGFGSVSGDPLATIAALVQAVQRLIDRVWGALGKVVDSFGNIVGTEMTAEWSYRQVQEVIDLVLPLPYLEMLGSMPSVVQRIVTNGQTDSAASTLGQAAEENSDDLGDEGKVETSEASESQHSTLPKDKASTVAVDQMMEEESTFDFPTFISAIAQSLVHVVTSTEEDRDESTLAIIIEPRANIPSVRIAEELSTAEHAASSITRYEMRTDSIDYLAAWGVLFVLAAASFNGLHRQIPRSFDSKIGRHHGGNE